MNILLHPDELFLKGSNQPFFYLRLIKNLKTLFLGVKVKRIEGGLWMENFPEAELTRLSLVPGIANFAEAVQCGVGIEEMEKGIEEIIACGERSVFPLIGGRPNGDPSFRISAERSYKKYKHTSFELEKILGDYARIKTGWKVDLDKPDINIHINIQKGTVFIYGNTINGAGGLPAGVSGKILCLISGGIDSPVAAYQMMRRGAQVKLIHFENQTTVSEEVSQKIFDLAKTLAQYQGNIRLHIVPFAPIQKQIIMKVPSDYRMLIVRRMMFKIAERIARRNKCLALVTGDSLGQVASQTLENLVAVHEATPMLKLAPLIGSNKKDIMALARRIGTLEISNRPYEDCCSLFVARHPATRGSLAKVIQMEERLNLSTLDKLEIKSYHIGA